MDLIDNILLPGSLWLIMYSIGLSLTLEDFRLLMRNRRALYVGVASMLIVAPLIGVLMALTFAPTPALAVGFVLLATCPGGMLSNLMTDIAKGDLALSLSLSILVSMIYILVIPFYAHVAVLYFLGVEQTVQVPLTGFIWKIFSITLLPASLGLLTRHYRPRLALASKGKIKLGAMAILLVAFGFIIADQLPVLRENFGALFYITAGMNLLALSAAFVFSKGARLSGQQVKAVCIEHMIRQEGTAIYIAVTIVGSREMSLPMIMNTPVALILCIAFVLAMRRYGESRRSVASPVVSGID